jgi:hypothetical protein
MKYLIRLAMEISQELHTLKELIRWDSRKFSERLGEEWIDSKQVMIVLNIKKRALQKLRDMGLLPFSTIHGKLYYKVSDVEELLKSNYIKRGNRQRAIGNRR